MRGGLGYGALLGRCVSGDPPAAASAEALFHTPLPSSSPKPSRPLAPNQRLRKGTTRQRLNGFSQDFQYQALALSGGKPSGAKEEKCSALALALPYWSRGSFVPNKCFRSANGLWVTFAPCSPPALPVPSPASS